MERAKVIVAIEESIAFPMLTQVLPKCLQFNKQATSARYSDYVRDSEIGNEMEPYDDNDDDNVTMYSTRMDMPVENPP